MSAMTSFHWFLPAAGDGREVGNVIAEQARSARSTDRKPSVAYLAQVARAAEQAGFAGVLTPVGLGCEEPFLLCTAVAQHTTTLRFIVAVRPGLTQPTWLAHQAATFQRLSGGRLLLNVVSGGDPVEQRSLGDFLDHDRRYARTDEYLAVFKRMWEHGGFDSAGEFFPVEGAGLRLPGADTPRIYFGGASPAAEAVAARRADVYLTWGEPPGMIRPRIDRMRDLAARENRSLRLGIRLHIITRDTAEEAWREAQRILDGMDRVAIRASQERYARMESVGQARMASLHGGRTDRLEIAPNLWAGIGLVREGAATALVGSHVEVAERIDEYRDLGFNEFILSGYPHLEEAYRVGECVLPLISEARSVS